MKVNDEGSLQDEIVARIEFVISLTQSYNGHKKKVLYDSLKALEGFAEAKMKTCRNKALDVFRGASTVEIVVNHSWSSTPGFYQAYYPIKHNVYFQNDMDWMELARPAGLPQAPDPLKFTNQESFYPPELDDERHTKLRLIMNFGHNEYGYDPVFLNVVALMLELPEKLVINYFFKTFKDQRENSLAKRITQEHKKSFQSQLKEYQAVFGDEASQLLSVEDLEDLNRCQPSNRSFLLTQYFCLYCEMFFCPDHVHSDYSPLYYFQEDETEYSEFKSDLYRIKRKSHLEIEKQSKADLLLPPTLQNLVECAPGNPDCFRNNNNSDADVIISMIKMEKDQLNRAKNTLRVCINSGTNVPCFIESMIPGLKCREVGALMAKLYVDEFKKSPIEPGLSRTDIQQRRAAFDKKKNFSKLEMDSSQFPHVFCEDFQFPIHALNRLMQKNRVLIGTSTICPGLGLFAGQRFRKDQLVCLYFGEILEEEETANYRAKINTLYDTSYVFSLSDGTKFSIDSLVYGNKSRFVNHNEGHLNNCIIELTEISKKEYIVFKAKRDIEFGEELFFDYGDSYTLNWKYIYKHMYSFMMKVYEKKRSQIKMKNKLKSTIQNNIMLQ